MKEIPSCVYCGDWYQCRDHVTPLSWLRVYRDYRLSETVHCCEQCNRLAGNFIAFSICEKADYLIGRYETKFARALALPEWSRDDIAELGGMLKRRVESNEKLRQIVLLKLENLKLVSVGFKSLAFRCPLSVD